MKKTLVFLSLGALGGCFKPVDGDYQITPGDVTTDCETVDASLDDDLDPVAVDVNDEKDSMTWGDEHADISGYSNECTLDGKDFDCLFLDDSGDDGSGTTIGVQLQISGTWTSNTSVEATMVANGTCEGDGCADYEAMGAEFCNTSQELVAELVE